MPTMTQPASTQVTVGVDTHLEVHVAVVKDQLGRRLATTSVATTPAGYGELLGWAQHLGPINAWGIEGTGSFGAGLTRFLRSRGQVVVEVNRPDRAARRRRGKSDPLDAEAAARAAQAHQGSVPKAGDGQVEMIRSLRVARTTAIRARTQAINALKALVVTAPDELREQLRALSAVRLVRPPPAWNRVRHHPGGRGQARLADPGPPLPGALSRAGDAGRRAGPADQGGRAQAGGAVWGRVGLGRGAAGRRRRQPTAAALGRRVLDAVRGLADPGLLGQDPAASAESGW